MMTEDEVAAERRRRGYWLRLARLRADLNQNEVARQLGMSERSGTTVLAWEQGRRDPSASTLARLARLYEVPADLLLRPPKTDRERLDELALAAGALEHADWEREQAGRPSAEVERGDMPGRRSA